jgi:polysaccharide biosynthesis/export protein
MLCCAVVLRRSLECWKFSRIAALWVAVTLGACSPPAISNQPNFVTIASESAPDRLYRLGVGDKFKLTVFGEDNLSGQFEVNAVGQVSLPLIGEMPAKNLTLQQFRDNLVRKLSDGYLKNPKVTVEILNYRPIYVHGEVKNGGEFQYKNGLSMRDAVAMAGGFTYRAEQSYFYIARNGAAEVAVRGQTDVMILPGDNIRIPERFF